MYGRMGMIALPTAEGSPHPQRTKNTRPSMTTNVTRTGNSSGISRSGTRRYDRGGKAVVWLYLRLAFSCPLHQQVAHAYQRKPSYSRTTSSTRSGETHNILPRYDSKQVRLLSVKLSKCGTCFRSSILSASDMSSSSRPLVGAAPRCPVLPPVPPIHPAASAFDNNASSWDTARSTAQHRSELRDNRILFIWRGWVKAVSPLATQAAIIDGGFTFEATLVRLTYHG